MVREGVNRDVWAGAEGAGVGGRGKKGGGGWGGAQGGMVGRHARLFAVKAERKRLYILPTLPTQIGI